MLFNSWGYLLFMLVALPTYWALPTARARLWLIAAGSLLFYGLWRWDFLVLMVASASTDYVAGWKIGHSEDERVRRRWLVLTLVVNLGLLVGFKYTYFLWDNARLLGKAGGAEWPPLQELGLTIVLPLGISFYTFQSVCYTIDVYRRQLPPIRDYLTFLCFVTYWPQLVAGPILRVQEVVPQLLARHRFSADDLASGLERIVVGLFKKVVLADSLSPFVDEAFALDPARCTALDAWVMAFLFGFQIYFDFAGYSDIAIGSARTMGLRFPDNFDWPYLARSPREFWTRWHISLSAWIRDYLYLPLAGQRFRGTSTGGIGEAATAEPAPGARRDGSRHGALFLTWFIMGLWHGAAWTFAVWGLYHATTIFLFRVLGPLKTLPERRPVLAWMLTLPVAMAPWLFFRATSLGQALVLFGKLLDPREYRFTGHVVDIYAYFWALVVLLGLVVAAWAQRRPWPRWLALAASFVALACMTCATLVSLRTAKQFIYFQF